MATNEAKGTQRQEIAPYVNDAWIYQDERDIGLLKAGDKTAEIALSAPPPFTFAVTGKWGSGKTSVMKRAFFTLGGAPVSKVMPLKQDGEVTEIGMKQAEDMTCGKRQKALGWDDSLYRIAENSLCVWFSPWQHQSADNPLVALLLEIRSQYSTWFKLREKAGKLNRQGGLAGAALIEKTIDAAWALTTGQGSFASGFTAAVRSAWKEEEEKLDKLSDGQRFQLLFQDAVETALKGIGEEGAPGRLIIFIDDLDRCDEGTIVRMLEAIKLYLGTDRCIFVLGMDDAAILAALQKHWGRGEDFNRDYLDKLLQAALPVPQPNAMRLQRLIDNQL